MGVLQIPIGAEDEFKGMVDLVSMKGITWDGEVILPLCFMHVVKAYSSSVLTLRIACMTWYTQKAQNCNWEMSVLTAWGSLASSAYGCAT